MDLENDNQMGLNDRKGKGPEWKAVKRRLSSEGQGCRRKSTEKMKMERPGEVVLRNPNAPLLTCI